MHISITFDKVGVRPIVGPVHSYIDCIAKVDMERNNMLNSITTSNRPPYLITLPHRPNKIKYK